MMTGNEEIRAALVDRVASHADRWRTSVENARLDRVDLIAYVRAAADNGVSEYELAGAAGVTRSTVRAWLGK